MLNSIHALSKDKDCRFSLDAKNGGTLYSSFADNTLRNFYANSYTWTDFQTAGNTIGHDNFEFEITFKNSIAIPASPFSSLFYHNGQQGTVNIAYDCNFTINFMYYKMWADDGTTLYPGVVSKAAIDASGVDIVSAGAVHTWKCGKIGSTIYVKINDITVLTNTQAYLETSNYKSNTAPGSVFNGNILSAKLTNLTSNIVLWQASKNQLFNADAIFPSATLRNFATETATWQDFQKNILAYGGYGDIKVHIDFFAHEEPTVQVGIFNGRPLEIIYSPSTKRLSLTKFYNGGTLYLYHTISFTGFHTIDVIANSTRMDFTVDGTTLSNTLSANAIQWLSNSTPYTNAPISIINANCTVNEKPIWSYPSFEEKTRLITKVNTYTDNGYFERARDTGTYLETNWYIKTPCFIQGSTKSLTMITRCYFSDTSANGTWNFRSPIGDENMYISFRNQTGNTNAGASQGFVFVAVLRNSTNTADVQLSVSITDWVSMAKFLNKWITLAMVLDFDSSEFPILKCYSDGVLIGVANGNANYSKILSSRNPTVPVCIGNQNLVTTAYKNGFEKVSYALLLTRAFTEGEIRAFTYDNERVIDIDITTVSNDEEVVLSDSTTTLTSDLIINWGDGVIERVVRNSTNYTKISHIYATSGNYKITASGRLSLSHANGATKTAWRYINKFDMIKMGFISCNYTFQVPNLIAFNTSIIFPDYIKSCLQTFLTLGCDIPANTTLPSSNTIAYGLFNQSKITRIRNGFTFGNVQSSGTSFSYLCTSCTELIEVEDGVKYPSSLTASTTSQILNHYSGCGKLTHLSVNLFDDLNMDNFTGNAFYGFIRYDSKLKNLPNAMRFSALLTDLDIFAQGCSELEWNITDKFPVFPAGATIKMGYTFSGCGKITGYVDPAKLWKRTDITWTVVATFGGCVSLTNYDEIPVLWGGLGTASISTNRTWTDVWTDKTVNITSTGSLTCIDNKGIINMVSGSILNITTNTGTINYVSGSIINGTTKTQSGSLVGSL